ncbi:MAG: Metallophos protein, partial [Bacteroidetes bacterium]|nr:Metallophos protein [Bacteroidota bacterium]
LQCSEGCCEYQVVQMMNGHPVFFNALAEFLAKENEIKILKGNHDIQLYWRGVRRQIVERLADLVQRKGKQLADSQVEFLPWFYYVPDLLYVEHGNQYEATTAFRNFLHPLLPSSNRKRRNPQLELDLSSFLVRYLTNRLEPVNQLADNIRPLTKYYGTMWKAHPYEMIDTLGTAFRFVLKAFRKAREQKRGAKSAEYEQIRDTNSTMIHKQAGRFSDDDPDVERWLETHLVRFDERRMDPILEGGAFKFVWEIIKEASKSLKILLPLYVLTFIPDLGKRILDLINGTGITWLIAAAEFLYKFNLLHVLVIVIVGLALIWLVRKRRRSKSKDKKSTVLPDVSMEMREHAKYIVQSLGVKYVTFGHTHYVDTCALHGDARYFNTGTWMGIYEEQEQLYREAHQFTFLLVENSEPWLLRWNADGKTPFPVVVVDNAPPLSGEEDSIVKLVMKAVKL